MTHVREALHVSGRGRRLLALAVLAATAGGCVTTTVDSQQETWQAAAPETSPQPPASARSPAAPSSPEAFALPPLQPSPDDVPPSPDQVDPWERPPASQATASPSSAGSWVAWAILGAAVVVPLIVGAIMIANSNAAAAQQQASFNAAAAQQNAWERCVQNHPGGACGSP